MFLSRWRDDASWCRALAAGRRGVLVEPMSETVSIIGTGNVGAALAKNLVQQGVHVRLVGNKSDRAQALASELGTLARAVSLEGARGADFVVLAVPASAAADVMQQAGGFPGSIVLDATNPLTWSAGPVHAPPKEGSLAAHLAHRFPGARLVKTFNTFGAEFHGEPAVAGTPVDLYLAGDDAGAKERTAALARRLGFEPVDVGPLRNAQHLESLAILWIHLATVGGQGRQIAFKLLRR